MSTKERKPKQHSLNQSQLKSLTENLRLRLRYAKLKVINGWHHQTLNEIESTIYYLLPQNHSNQQRQPIKKPNPPSATHPPLFNLPKIPPPPTSPSKPTPVPTFSQSTSDQSGLESSFMIKKSNLLSSTTLTLPIKYSTPYKKSLTSGDQSDPYSSESSRFWPSRALECPPTATPIRINGSNRKNRKCSLEGLVLKMAGMEPKSSKESNRLDTQPMEDFHELYKQSSPASFLFNYHQRSILDSSSAKRPSRPSLLNSISPVRIRSSLHQQSYPHPRLARLANNSLESPTPTRTLKPQLGRIFTPSSSTSKNDKLATNQLLPEDGDDDEEEDKENWMDLDDNNPNHKSSPLKSRSASLLKFKLHPHLVNNDNDIDQLVEDVDSNPTQIGLDDLDQLIF